MESITYMYFTCFAMSRDVLIARIVAEMATTLDLSLSARLKFNRAMPFVMKQKPSLVLEIVYRFISHPAGLSK